MSKTKIEQYPNSLMTVSKLLSKRNRKYSKSNIDDSEKVLDNKLIDKDIEKTKPIFLSQIDALEDDIYLLISSIQNTKAGVATTEIARRVAATLNVIVRNYEAMIIKKPKNFNLYELQQISDKIFNLAETYDYELYEAEVEIPDPDDDTQVIDVPVLQAYIDKVKVGPQIFDKISELLDKLLGLLRKVNQTQPLAKFEGGYLSSISDSLASNYRIK